MNPRILVVALFLMDSLFAVGAQNPLFPVPVLPVEGAVESVEAIDLDEDGITDLAAGVRIFRSSEIVLWRGTKEGGLVQAGKIPTTAEINALRSGDIDGDGHSDLVTLSLEEATVSVFLGRGDGTLEDERVFSFGMPPDRPVFGSFPQLLDVVDLDGDGREDILLVDKISELVVIRSKVDGFLEDPERFPAGSLPLAVKVAHLNNDEYPDVIVAAQNTGALFLYFGLPDGTLAAPIELPVGHAPQALAVDDFNVDNHPDIAVTDLLSRDFDNGGEVWVILADGAGSFFPPVPHRVIQNPIDLVSIDMTGDGISDLITANIDSNDISVMVGSGDGNFEEQKKTFAGVMPISIAVEDLDRDGIPDVAVAATGSVGIPLLHGNLSGNLEMNIEVPMPARPNDVHAGDFNGDGHIDLAVPSRLFVGQNQSLFFLAGHGDSSFEEPIRLDVGFDPFRAAVSRLNDDGLDDLALINCGSNDISILLGHPVQGFSPETRIAVGIDPIAIVAGDLNGDGIQELVVANTGTKDLSLLRHDPGGFALSATVPLGERPENLAVIPDNRNGSNVLAVGLNLGPVGEMRFFTTDGGEGLDAIREIALDGPPFLFQSVQFGRDILPDLIVMPGLPRIDLFRNVRKGLPRRSDSVVGLPVFILDLAVEDIDGDGFLDLLALTGNLRTVSVFRGRGGQHFGHEERYLVGPGRSTFEFADFDEDGDLDLATVNPAVKAVTLVPNLSTNE